jgi:hypothetical protein
MGRPFFSSCVLQRNGRLAGPGGSAMVIVTPGRGFVNHILGDWKTYF